jgi:hypothetical protein
MLLHISGCRGSRHRARSSEEPEDQELLAFVFLKLCSGHDVISPSCCVEAFELYVPLNWVFRRHAAILRSDADFILRDEARDGRRFVKGLGMESKWSRDGANEEWR